MDIYNKIYSKKYFEKLQNSKTKDKVIFLTFHDGKNQDSINLLNEFKKHLQIADENGTINHDRKGKLTTFRWETFIQAWAELQVAYYFKGKLGFNIGYEPKRISNGKGDIEIIISDGPNVFVEVTTPIRQQPDVIRTDVLCEYHKNVIITSLTGKYRELPTDGRPTMIIIGGGLAGGLAPVQSVMKASIDEFYSVKRENLSAACFLDFGLKLMYLRKPPTMEYNLEIYPNQFALIKLPEIVLREINKYQASIC